MYCKYCKFVVSPQSREVIVGIVVMVLEPDLVEGQRGRRGPRSLKIGR